MEKFEYQLVFELKYNTWHDAFWLKLVGYFMKEALFIVIVAE